jgi:tartrate dehydrogenase/decarboxylase / D-malate dehydrogenase
VSRRRQYRLAAVPGDGIGKEVVPAAIEVLDAVAAVHDFTLEWHTVPWGCEHYLEHGEMMPPDGLDTLRPYDAVFLGAVGHPDVPDHVSLWGLLIPIRRGFRQAVNVRPSRVFDGVLSPLSSADASIDFTVIRENNEGEYSTIGGRTYQDTDQEMAVQVAIFTRKGVERVVRYAFDLARTRRSRVASATKSNGIVHTMPFWDEIFDEVGEQYPDVERSTYHADALAALLVLDPRRFDVIVASNLLGDILTDLGSAVTGSIGLGPSANLNLDGECPSMFEPVHGSAPDIAGRGVANPLGQIWAGSMMLEHLGESVAAAAVLDCVEWSLSSPETRTPDVAGRATTAEVIDSILARVNAHHDSAR